MNMEKILIGKALGCYGCSKTFECVEDLEAHERKTGHGEITEVMISRGKRQIENDVITGVVPKKVRNFSRLHNYVDANKYLTNDFTESAPSDEAGLARVNEVSRRLNAWIRRGMK